METDHPKRNKINHDLNLRGKLPGRRGFTGYYHGGYYDGGIPRPNEKRKKTTIGGKTEIRFR